MNTENESVKFPSNIIDTDIHILRHFGYPEIKKLQVDIHGNGRMLESVGEIFNIRLDDKHRTGRFIDLPKGKRFILFRKQEIKRLLESSVGAVELVLTDKNEILIILHHINLEQ